MTKYEVTLSWSDADDAFVARVPELPGCMAHGATREEASKHIAEAMQLWLDTAREFGDPIPTPKGRAADARVRLAVAAAAPRSGTGR